MPSVTIELRTAGAPPRTVVVTHPSDVGRECDGVILDDPAASRRHLRVEPAAGGLLVTDLGSSNGTLLEGQRIEGSVLVTPGRSVRLGSTELAVVAAEGAPGAAAPQPQPAPRAEAAAAARPAVPPAPPPVAGSTGATGQGTRRTLSLDGALVARLQSAHRRLNYELDGVAWRDLVEAVITAGLADDVALRRLLRPGD